MAGTSGYSFSQRGLIPLISSNPMQVTTAPESWKAEFTGLPPMSKGMKNFSVVLTFGSPPDLASFLVPRGMELLPRSVFGLVKFIFLSGLRESSTLVFGEGRLVFWPPPLGPRPWPGPGLTSFLTRRIWLPLWSHRDLFGSDFEYL